MPLDQAGESPEASDEGHAGVRISFAMGQGRPMFEVSRFINRRELSAARVPIVLLKLMIVDAAKELCGALKEEDFHA